MFVVVVQPLARDECHTQLDPPLLLAFCQSSYLHSIVHEDLAPFAAMFFLYLVNVGKEAF